MQTTGSKKMAPKKKETKSSNTQLNWKKKKWREALAPATFASQPIGEIFTETADQMIEKTVPVNLMHLTKNPRKQNITVTFKITGVEENKGVSKSYSYVMLPASIKRLVRSGRDRIDESFIIKTKECVYARIKPLMITHSRQPQAIQTKVRRQIVSYMRKYAAETEFEALIKECVDGKLAKTLKDQLSKITRLRNLEIRALEMIENFSDVKQRKLEKRQKIEEERAKLAAAASEDSDEE
jgi:ribosomal protein S3AE